MNHLSLFSGIGGLDLGLERAGFATVGQVEIDSYCQRVLAKHWPEVPKHDDVRTAVDWWRPAERPPVHLVSGGFHCQPFAPGGKRRGVDDERWSWPWMRDVIAALQPTYVLVENSERLPRDGVAFGRILSDLRDLRFDAEWSVVTACAVGRPHVRKRVFLVAYPASERVEFGWRVELPQGGDRPRDVCDGPEESEPHRVADGVPHRVDRNRALGNAVVPQVAEAVGRLIIEFDDRR